MNMYRNLITLAIALMTSIPGLYAQLRGEITYEHLGITFTIPPDWQGQELEDGVLLASNTIAGFVMISTHQYTSLDQLRQEASVGLIEEGGTQMQMQGDFESLNQQSIAARFGGTFEYEPAKAYMAGIINPQGMGLMVAAFSTSEAYGAAQEQVVRDLISSTRFTTAKSKSVVEEWREYFLNSRLTYVDNYSSGSYSSGGLGGGYSSNVKIDLCARGYFNYHSNSSMSIGGDGASAISSGGSNGQGTWQVMGTAQGGAVLQLEFYNGETYEYTLSYEDEKVHLNGERYYVTSEGEYAPDCY